VFRRSRFHVFFCSSFQPRSLSLDSRSGVLWSFGCLQETSWSGCRMNDCCSFHDRVLTSRRYPLPRSTIDHRNGSRFYRWPLVSENVFPTCRHRIYRKFDVSQIFVTCSLQPQLHVSRQAPWGKLRPVQQSILHRRARTISVVAFPSKARLAPFRRLPSDLDGAKVQNALRGLPEHDTTRGYARNWIG
jgi:hypothetical protein